MKDIKSYDLLQEAQTELEELNKIKKSNYKTTIIIYIKSKEKLSDNYMQ
ncbi:MAG: hypothetical protein U9N59_16335 [Campylobacterota bacterium]|nr:hypothetical protein [Campylobacterota bacterium]